MELMPSPDSPGIRTICDLDLSAAEVVPEGVSIVEFCEPGDVVLFRRTGDWLTTHIAELDGYWTHAGIYVGDGNIAHTHIGGVDEIGLVEMVNKYSAGVGIVRLGLKPSVLKASVEWARSIASSDDPSIRYSGWELGMAFALLRRAAARRGWELAPVPNDDYEMLGMWDKPQDNAFTCAGFVYSAFSIGAGTRLNIEPAPGLRVEDGRVYAPDEITMFESIVYEDDDGELWASELEGVGRPSLLVWRTKAKLLLQATTGWMAVAIGDRSVPLEQGVTLSDLWCSPDAVGQWFVTEEHRKQALAESAWCENSGF